MSILALAFLLLLTLFAALWEILLWWAFRHGNRVVLLHSSGLVVLLFALPLSIAFYNLLEKSFLYVSWPRSWVSNNLAWLLTLGIIGPFLWVGFGLLWDGPRRRTTSPPSIEWSWVWAGIIVGCLVGIISALHWFGGFSFPSFLLESSQGQAPILFGAFRLDEFFYGFLLCSVLTIPRMYAPRLLWWVQTFSERRWFAIGTTLLLLSIALVAVLIA